MFGLSSVNPSHVLTLFSYFTFTPKTRVRFRMRASVVLLTMGGTCSLQSPGLQSDRLLVHVLEGRAEKVEEGSEDKSCASFCQRAPPALTPTCPFALGGYCGTGALHRSFACICQQENRRASACFLWFTFRSCDCRSKGKMPSL